MRLLLLLFALALAVSACNATTSVTTIPAVTAPQPTSTTVAAPSTTAPLEPCPPAPYEVPMVPPAVVPAASDVVDEPDEFTSMGGTHARLWVNGQGGLAIALIRGSLPPAQFPGERGEVEVAGSRGVAGPFPDGRWVVAWFNEPGDRCDEYTMVFYPPVSPAEVEATLAAMTRVPG